MEFILENKENSSIFWLKATFKRKIKYQKGKKPTTLEHTLKLEIYFTLKFMYSEKATKFFEISTNYLSYVLPVKWLVEILQNFVAFSEYMNLKKTILRPCILFCLTFVSWISPVFTFPRVCCCTHQKMMTEDLELTKVYP